MLTVTTSVLFGKKKRKKKQEDRRDPATCHQLSMQIAAGSGHTINWQTIMALC